MNTRTSALFFALLLGSHALAACSEPSTSDDTGTGGDVPPDIDGDGDGLSLSMDCDDTDATVGRTATRTCMNLCGAGTVSCADGRWTECPAPTDCACTTEGEMRVGTCGMCGMQSERCSGGVWTSASSCLGEGVCVPAAVEARDTERCGTQERLCAAMCTWSDWFQVMPDGECRLESRRSCPDDTPRDQDCDSTCHWETFCW